MKQLKAYRIHDEEGKISARFELVDIDDLTEGDVVIRAAYSGDNYSGFHLV